MFLKRFLVISLWIVSHASCGELTFLDAVDRFLSHNNDLKIAHYEIDKSKADLLGAQRRPNPILYGSYSFLDAKHHFKDQSIASPAFLVAHLEHPIELGGKRTQRIKTADEAIQYTQLLVEENKRQALLLLVSSYYQVQADQANYRNALKNRHDFEKLLTIAQGKFAHKLIDDVDLKELTLQWMSYNKEVEITQSTLLTDTQALAMLLSLKAEEISIPDISTDFPLMERSVDHLIDYAQTHRSDCLAAIQNVVVAKASVDLEKANAVPDISLGIETEHYAPNYTNPLLGVSAVIPLPLYNRNQGAIERAKVTVLQATAQQTKTLSQAAMEVRQAFIMYTSQKKVYASTQEEFNTIHQLKMKHHEIFEHHGMSILDLLDNLRRHHDYQKNVIQAMVDLHVAQEYLKLTAGFSLAHPKE